MKYSDVNVNDVFVGNMRQTSWSSLFPYWYMQDDFINTIGDQIELIKSEALFRLLNIGSKPPVLLWQNSLLHKKYTKTQTITDFPDTIYIRAPIYKTWGQINFTNNGDPISDLSIYFNTQDGVTIYEDIDTGDEVSIDITNQKFYINNKLINPQLNGQGVPYFITSQNNEEYQKDTPLHNEILAIHFSSPSTPDTINLDTTITLNNVVFENEQNIEITGLELIPIKEVILYAEYDFPYNKKYNGMKKVYVKNYDKGTNVVYDMITTHFYTKKFYVEVWFKGIDYPYTIGFPAYKDADTDSMYHVNEKLNDTGEILGLSRRIYKTDIPEEDYPFTFPEYYPFDIEQDYWYYQRLVNEYAWNENAIDRVDVKDTEDNTVMRLHSINPFIEDFVVYTNSTYPDDIEGINYQQFLPSFVYQESDTVKNLQATYQDVQNLLRENDNFAYVNLAGKSDNNITFEGYKSKELGLYFNLESLPEEVNIDGFEIIIDTESTDNSLDKYNDDRTRIQLADDKTLPGAIEESGHYELRRKKIVYGDNKTLFGLETIPKSNNNVKQKIIIKEFTVTSDKKYQIPFEYYEAYGADGEFGIIDTIDDAMIFYYNESGECIDTGHATYRVDSIKDSKAKYRYLLVDEMPHDVVSYLHIISTEKNYHPFNIKVDVQSIENEESTIIKTKGPYNGTKILQSITYNDVWYTADLRDLLQKNGLYFIYTLTNDSKTNSSTVLLHNIFLKVYYSPKKTDFKLSTKLYPTPENKDHIATFDITIENIGEKDINKTVDIITPNNLLLYYNGESINYIDTGDIEINDFKEIKGIEIKYNSTEDSGFTDGRYDIVTVCEDQQIINQLRIMTSGSMVTTTVAEPMILFRHNPATLRATVNNLKNDNIDGKVEFKINGYTIGTSNLINNTAELTITPSDYDFIIPGINTLLAHYLGTDKYSSSKDIADIFVKRNKTNIKLNIPDIIIQKDETQVSIEVYYEDETGEYPVPEGNVTLYIDDEEMFTKTLIDGKINQHTFKAGYNVGNLIVRAVYNGTDDYPPCEVSQPITIIGGKVKIVTPDIDARPTEEITLKSYITDMNDNNIPYGFVDYTIQNVDEEIIYESKNVIVYNGMCGHKYTIPSDAIPIEEQDETVTYKLIASYHSERDGDIDVESYSNINIARGKVTLIYHNELKYSDREPLGFYVEVFDSKTGQPVTDGEVTITVPKQPIITLTEPVDEQGKVRAIFRPIEFSAYQWKELMETKFTMYNNILGDPQIKPYMDENETIPNPNYPEGATGPVNNPNYIGNQYAAYYYHSDLWFENLNTPELIDFKLNDKVELIFDNEESRLAEHVYISKHDGNVYIRTTDDNLEFEDDDGTIIRRRYYTGTYNVSISYYSQYQYKTEEITSVMTINNPEIDVDMYQYDIKYDSENLDVIAYVTEYNRPNQDTANLITEGNINYYVDGALLSQSPIQNGMAILDKADIPAISHGRHLLEAEYVGEVPTYTYTFIDVKKAETITSVTWNRIFAGKTSKWKVKVKPRNTVNIEITGDIYIYLDDTQIGYAFLTGEEDGEITVTVNIPEDADIAQYRYKVVYGGDNHYASSSTDGDLTPLPLPVKITGDINDIYITPNTEYNLTFNVNTESIEDNDDISQGNIVITNANTHVVRKFPVINNTVQVTLQSSNDIGDEEYSVEYQDAKNYECNDVILFTVHTFEGYPEVYLDGTTIDNHFDKLKLALWAVQNKGKVYIQSWTLESGKLDNSFILNKDIDFIGINTENEVIPPYIKTDINEILDIDLIMHYRSEFTNEQLQNLHLAEIETSQININEYRIIDKELYYIDENKLVPIYLFDDGLFYTEASIKPADTTIYTNGHEISFENITFENGDWYNNFVIDNSGNLTIKQCIIKENVKIKNHGILTCNENLIYGEINVGNQYDINNNWWGQNTSPIPTKNNIILQLTANKNPPVVGEMLDIKLEFIGENGEHYNLPPVDFKIYAESGNVTIDSGTFVDSQIITSYNDATHEGKIYGEVDNQKVSMTIYDYDKKTEVILQNPKVIPIGYQTTIKAMVQSCADTFYKFDENNNLKSQTNNINTGYVKFFFDDNQVGKVKVNDGEAILSIYLNNANYNHNDEFELKAIYEPDGQYFESQAKSQIKLIDEIEVNVKYISPTASSNGNGTFGNPYNTIAQALESIPINSTETYTFYLKEGEYRENIGNIIGYNIEIIKYDNNVRFTDVQSTIFNVTGSLTLKGIDFLDNTSTVFKSDNFEDEEENQLSLIKNTGTLIIEDCTFYNNKTLIDNKSSINTDIKKSVIVNNTNILTDYYDSNFNISYCWFGTNNPNGELFFGSYKLNDNNEKVWTKYNQFNNYIVMDFKAAKDIIYIGSVVHIIASLDKYQHNEDIYDYNDTLPLRVALFNTTYGSLMPLRDYTHNKIAISLLNTTELVNSDKIAITAGDNTNYVNRNLKLQVNVSTTNGNPINDGTIEFHIFNNKKQSIPTQIIDIHNGIALLDTDKYKLVAGNYILKCVYNDNQEVYQANFEFTVQLPTLSFNNTLINDGDHLYNLIFDADISDSIGAKVHNIPIKCYIDKKSIGQFIIKDNHLHIEAEYEPIKAGVHKLVIENIELNNYKPFSFEYNFLSTEKNTYILFEQTGMEAETPTDLIAYVYDDNHKLIDGEVTFTIDGEDVIQNDSNVIKLYNGKAVIKNCTLPIGRHSITIIYHGIKNYYRDTIEINDNFNVGIYPVKIVGLNDIFIIDVNETIKFDNVEVLDVFDHSVSHGKIYFYIDDVCLNEDTPAEIHNGRFNYHLNTATIKIGQHDFDIKYIDESDVYADTNFAKTLVVTQVQTEININNTIIGTPNTTFSINYNVSAKIAVTDGKLKAYIIKDGIKHQIGIAFLSDTVNRTIPLTISNEYESGDYELEFIYEDENGVFAPSEKKNVKLILELGKVFISTSHMAYYPNEEFDFAITLTDIEGKSIEVGTVSMYIDGVLEQKYKELDVLFGEVHIPMTLSQAREYLIDIVYHQNKYYEETPHHQIISTNKIDIDEILILGDLTSLSGEPITRELEFITLANHVVKDGIIDIRFDNTQINSYYIQESSKAIKIDVPITYIGEHELILKYHGSDMFNDKTTEFVFTITPDPITLTIPERIDAELNNEIIIPVTLDKTVDGVIKFWISEDEEHYNLIGTKIIQNQNRTEFKYQIPASLNADVFNIKATFGNNSKYQDAEAIGKLYINKLEPTIVVNDITASYQDIIYISAITNIEGNEPIQFYLDGHNIGEALTANKVATLTYRLTKSHKAGGQQYDIVAKYNGSPVIYPAESEEAKLTINNATPILNKTCYSIYKRNDLRLENILIGARNNLITEGNILIKNNNELIDRTQVNTQTIIDKDDIIDIFNAYHKNIPGCENNEIIKEGFDLNVKFIPLVDNEYNEFEETINVIVNKNPLRAKTLTIPPTYRGEDVDIDIVIDCDTISKEEPIEIDAKINHETIHIDNRTYTYTIAVSPEADYPDSGYYELTLETIENALFESISIPIYIPLKNRNEVYIDANIGNDANKGTEDYPVKTFDKAYDLLANNGTIILKSDIELSNSQYIDKSIIIKGESHTINNANINTESPCVFTQTTFNNGNIESNKIEINECNFINTKLNVNDEFEIQYSTFSENTNGAIEINNKNKAGIIEYCIFEDNNTTNGGAIYAHKGNDLIIRYNIFTRNEASGRGASIYLNGDSIITHNSFYENIGSEDIYIVSGAISTEFNLFDNNTTYNIVNYTGTTTANMTYWGTNNIDEIDPNPEYNIEGLYKTTGDGIINVDSWLESTYHIDPKLDTAINYKITPLINQYRIREDYEHILVLDPIITLYPDNMKAKLYPTYINETDKIWIEQQTIDEYECIQGTPTTLRIGKQEFIIPEPITQNTEEETDING